MLNEYFFDTLERVFTLEEMLEHKKTEVNDSGEPVENCEFLTL